MKFVLDVLGQFEPMEWLTIGLLIFAGVQVLVPHWSERNRLRERQRDEAAKRQDREREEDLAFQLAWAEHFRIEQLASQWETQDLVMLSALGVLNSKDVLPRDWSTVLSALARLSVEAGYLGGVALTLGHDTSRQIAILNGVVASFRQQYPVKAAAEIASMVRNNQGPQAAQLEADIKKLSADLALLLWDAVRQSPRAAAMRELRFSDDLTSDLGRAAVRELSARAQRGSGPASEPATQPQVPKSAG